MTDNDDSFFAKPVARRREARAITLEVGGRRSKDGSVATVDLRHYRALWHQPKWSVASLWKRRPSEGPADRSFEIG